MGVWNKFTEDAALWEKAEELYRAQYDALFNLCIVLIKLNRFQKAKEYMERFISYAQGEKYAFDLEEMKEILSRLEEAIKK